MSSGLIVAEILPMTGGFLMCSGGDWMENAQSLPVRTCLPYNVQLYDSMYEMYSYPYTACTALLSEELKLYHKNIWSTC